MTDQAIVVYRHTSNVVSVSMFAEQQSGGVV
jgi:hypothetical protein